MAVYEKGVDVVRVVDTGIDVTETAGAGAAASAAVVATQPADDGGVGWSNDDDFFDVDDEEAFLRELAAAQATPLPASGRARSQRAGQPGQQSTDQVDFDPIDSDLE